VGLPEVSNLLGETLGQGPPAVGVQAIAVAENRCHLSAALLRQDASVADVPEALAQFLKVAVPPAASALAVVRKVLVAAVSEVVAAPPAASAVAVVKQPATELRLGDRQSGHTPEVREGHLRHTRQVGRPEVGRTPDLEADVRGFR